jgi:hypothetical protein
MTILAQIQRKINLTSRIASIFSQYIWALLMAQTPRVNLTLFAKMCEVNTSQFSRLLTNHHEVALHCLNRQIRRCLKKLIKTRKPLVCGSPWKVAIIIDATLHQRSSRHLDNAQRFNHGDGWVTGHQWTNVLLVINGVKIPLPPIAFMTQKKCLDLNIAYQTEHERVMAYLNTLDMEDLLPGVKAEEILILCDAGYDNKALQKFILTKGWSFIVSLKKTRSVSTATQKLWQSVESLFQRTRKIGPWTTVRIVTNGGKKRKEVSVRTLQGSLRGVKAEATILSVEKPNKQRLYLACSKKNINPGVVLRLYKLRWLVEVFHKEVKSYLGLEGPGLVNFEAIHTHVLLVYLAYLLLPELIDAPTGVGTLSLKRRLQNIQQAEQMNKIILYNSRINSKELIKKYCQSVKSKLNAA